jgi:hypothetical protein
MRDNGRPDFDALAKTGRSFQIAESSLVGHTPTIAITPVADGRTGAFEGNAAKTWRMVERVYNLISENVFLPDGRPVRLVVAPEIVRAAPPAGEIVIAENTEPPFDLICWRVAAES